MSGGNEYGQCGEEPERKDDNGRPLRRDIVIPQPCAPKLSVRQVTCLFQCKCNDGTKHDLPLFCYWENI